MKVPRIPFKKLFLGFLSCEKSLYEVFQLQFWSDKDMSDCVCSGVERQRERSETRR